MEEETINWEDLPSDLLHLITNKIPDIRDFIRLRAVCKKWRTSISVSDLPPQFPWLIKLNNDSQSMLQFYSLSSRKLYNVPLAESSSKKPFEPASMFAHKYGFRDQFSLISCAGPRLGKKFSSLLNPLNNSEVQLPFPDGPQFSTAWISARNFEGKDSSSVLLTNGTHQLALCKHRNGSWDHTAGDSEYMYVYLKGLVFTVDTVAKVTNVRDIISREVIDVIPTPECLTSREPFLEGPYLVESSGEILSVFYAYTYFEKRYKFYIHRLKFGNANEHPCWVEVPSIGDQILFIDFGHCRGFSLGADHFPGFKGNSIYFIICTHRHCTAHLYNIENGETLFIDCPIYFRDFTWFRPSLNYI